MRAWAASLFGAAGSERSPLRVIVLPMKTITVCLGDITTLAVDAVVNSANRSLLGGGGVDRAIHRAAGPELLKACMAFNGCPVGSAVVTDGFALSAKRIIHAVGPVWLGGGSGEAQALASCVRAALSIAAQEGLASIAFPCISRGIHRFPADVAARVMIETMRASPYDGAITICCLKEEDYEAYKIYAEAPGR